MPLVMGLKKMTLFIRRISGINMSRNDIDRLSDLVGKKLNDLLIVGVRNAGYNNRDIVMEPDLPLTKALMVSIHEFRLLKEEIKIAPILKHLALYPSLERDMSEDVMQLLPDLAGTFMLIVSRLMKAIDPEIKKPDPEIWERVDLVLDLLL